ncbi:tetratricopeptide repeat protein [Calidifontimicrobium sp. SYSU G02091]|uniref:tetratricopeptide repeat protein n=1 Tax=Calidifontimicrobium sp. SYSU G02091 TaxID=2926421 RepID=UPI003FA457C3
MRVFAAMAPRDTAGALRLAEQWLASHPGDAVVWRALADTQLNAGQVAAARRSYEALLRLRPDDADAVNNLANILVQQSDPAALPMAERALALAPGTPHIVGTVGWAAFKAGQTDRAVQLLRDARLRDPSNGDTRYFLGSVLASLGRDAEAREELNAALAAGTGGQHRAQAQQLLATLK